MRGAMAALLLLTAGAYGTAQAHDHPFAVEGDAGWTAAERKSGHDEVLTMARIRQLAAINAGLTELARRDATACRWMNQIIGPETLGRQVAAFDTHPAIKGVIEAERMTVREYLLALRAVSETAISVHGAEHRVPVPAAASASNVSFYRQHRVEIEQLLDARDPC